jgi:GAF domain-containing protein/ActR/RegA family two-component response regulator
MTPKDQTSPVRILIADDDVSFRDELTQWLHRRLKLEVNAVPSGTEVLKKVREANAGYYTAVLLDHYFDDGPDGLEVLSELKRLEPDLAVIMFTGKKIDAGIEALRQGAYRYITKDVSPDEISILLQHIIEEREAERKHEKEHQLAEAARKLAELAPAVSRQELTQEIARAGKDLVNASVCIVWELDRTDNKIRVAEWAGELDEGYQKIVELDSADESVRKFLHERQALAISNVQKAPYYQFKDVAEKRNLVSLLTAPIVVQDRIIGILDAYTRDEYRFSSWEKELLITFATQAAMAIRQTEFFKHSQEVGRLAISGEQEKLTDYIAEAVHDLTGASVALWGIDERDNLLHIVAHRGLREEHVQTAVTPIEPGSSVTSIALWGNRPVFRTDILDDQEEPSFYHRAEAIEQGWRSFLSVPMLDQAGQPLGALSIYRQEPGGFSTGDQGLLMAFARHAATAFENTRRMRHLNAQLERLHQVAQQRKLEDVLAQILQGINAIVGEATSSSINLYDEETDRFEPSMAVGPLKDLLKIRPRRTGTGYYVLKSGQPLYLDDVLAPPSGTPTIRGKSIDRGIKSFGAIPLKRQDRVIGVLFVNVQRSVPFTAELRRVLELFADQAAVAIENARLLGKVSSRAQTLKKINKVGHSILSLPESGRASKPLLKQIANYALEELQADIIELYEYDQENDWYSLPAVSVGKYRDTSGIKTTHIYEDSLPAQIVRRRQPLYSPEAQKETMISGPLTRDHGASRFSEREQLVSVAGIPLQAKGKTVGVMFVNYRSPQAFSDTQREMIELFASQAAIAIENARLFRDIEDRAERLRRLQEVTAGISSGPADPNQVLGTIVENLSNMFFDAPCAIRVYNSVTDKFGDRVAVGLMDTAISSSDPRPGGASRHVLTTGEPLYVEDPSERLPNQQSAIRQVLLDAGIKAIAYLPLINEGNAIGILYVDLTTPRKFSPYDRQILELFADQAGIAIANAQLYGNQSKQITRLGMINQVAQQTTSILETDLLFEQATSTIWESFEYHSVSLFLLDESGKSLKLVALAGGFKEHAQHEYTQSVEKGLIGWTVRKTEPVLVPDVSKDPRYIPGYLTEKLAGSELCVPLMLGGKVIGALDVQDKKINAFDEADQTAMETLAAQIAIAIENARLYEQRSKDLAALQEINEAIVSKELDEILELVVDKAIDVMHGEYGELWLKERASGDLVLRVISGLDEKAAEKYKRLKAGVGSISMWVSKMGRPFICPDASCYLTDKGDQPVYLSIYKDAQSSVTVPLKYRGNVIGTLNIESTRLNAFTEEHARLLGSFADQAAIAIENAKRIRELETISELGKTLAMLET